MFTKSYAEKRQRLIDSLRRKGINDERVLEKMNKIPREEFIEDSLRNAAYDDNALPIECNQTISQPYTVAYMTAELNVAEGNKALEIGTGSGYQACLLYMLGAEVYTIERIPDLLPKARKMFRWMEMDIYSKVGDGTIGWPEYAPFDRIIVTAAAPEVPETLTKQLVIGGRMVVPVGSREYQVMYIIDRIGYDEFTTKKTDTFKFVPLIGEEGW